MDARKKRRPPRALRLALFTVVFATVACTCSPLGLDIPGFLPFFEEPAIAVDDVIPLEEITPEEMAPTEPAPTEPPPTEEPEGDPSAGPPFMDAEADEFFCSDNSPTGDPPVDILEVDYEANADGIIVRVTMAVSAVDTFEEDFSFSVQARIGQPSENETGGYQVGIYEIHAGEMSVGRLSTTEDIEPGTEADISAAGTVVTFFFPNTSLEEGDTVTARSFHLATEDDETTCDITEAFPMTAQ